MDEYKAISEGEWSIQGTEESRVWRIWRVIGCRELGWDPVFLAPWSILLTRKLDLGSSPLKSLLAKDMAETEMVMVDGRSGSHRGGL